MARFEKKDAAAKKPAAQPATKPTADEAAAAKRNAEQQKVAESDELYAKALNEKNGYTLVPKGKVEKNHTVKQVSDQVYPGDMVIAERL